MFLVSFEFGAMVGVGGAEEEFVEGGVDELRIDITNDLWGFIHLLAFCVEHAIRAIEDSFG